ncbi:uncharacterized protein LOC143040838 [Oratosquilla oratoria]|uniref:uncharacterized protein LOC143040838 n=1 Tax=Oratosquilla oratoria TaxID=337810 RepID=UPI003F76A162
MGSPLEVLIANFFMGCIEEEVFSKFEKPEIYCRYIDDIFIKTTGNEYIVLLKKCLQDASGLTFMIENSIGGTIPFLDILVKQQQGKFCIDTYVKPTNTVIRPASIIKYEREHGPWNQSISDKDE